MVPVALALVATWAPCLPLPVAAASSAGVDTIGHHLSITLAPRLGTLQVEDRIQPSRVQRAAGRVSLLLNRGLVVQQLQGGELQGAPEDAGDLRRYLIRLDPSSPDVTLSYGGVPFARAGSPLLLSPEAVNLDAASGWYALDPARGLLRYRLQTRLPPGWQVIASGLPAGHRSSAPLPGIQLVAAPFHMLRDGALPALSIALRSPDEPLAARYMAAARRYLHRYEALLGAYPYPGFSVVENIAPTGLGYPAFTLLGQRVMRLPFIPHTSLPHEILHNWWGNGVFVDASQGNWSEGLTTYLADHLQKELAGEGSIYRRDALARYRNAHLLARARPLVTFRARHDRASQSLGYDRALMVFHMMRKAVGDRRFLDGLRAFFSEGRFQRRTTGELMAALVRDPHSWFAQWWGRADAPKLALECCTLGASSQGNVLSGRLRQIQAGAPFPLRVLLALSVAGESRARLHTVRMSAREQAFALTVPAQPLHLRVDPAHDLMRLPALEELPPSVSEVLQARRRVAVLPAGLGVSLQQAYRSLATAFETRILEPGAALPGDASAVIAFHHPGPVADAFGPELIRLASRAASYVSVGRVDSGSVVGSPRSAMVLRLEEGPQLAASARRMAAVLPRYGRYARLAFTSPGLRNVFKAHGPVGRSPLEWRAHDRAQPLPLPSLPVLTDEAGGS